MSKTKCLIHIIFSYKLCTHVSPLQGCNFRKRLNTFSLFLMVSLKTKFHASNFRKFRTSIQTFNYFFIPMKVEFRKIQSYYPFIIKKTTSVKKNIYVDIKHTRFLFTIGFEGRIQHLKQLWYWPRYLRPF